MQHVLKLHETKVVFGIVQIGLLADAIPPDSNRKTGQNQQPIQVLWNRIVNELEIEVQHHGENKGNETGVRQSIAMGSEAVQ